jgi:Uma2 family endonuclease
LADDREKEIPVTALPTWLTEQPENITASEYEAMSEEVCHRIEIIDGIAVLAPAPRRPHQRISRRLSNTFEGVCGDDFEVETDIDLRLHDVPLLNRRPDVVIYDAGLSNDAVLRPEHCLLVMEVMSPGSETSDQVHKPGEYAAAGITHFWRVENPDDTGKNLSIFCYRLNPTTRTYVLTGEHTGKMTITDPFDISIDFDDLLH